MEKLGLKDIHDSMDQAHGWELIGHEIQKVFHFKSFQESLKFVNALAPVAEKQDHHPEIYIKQDKVTLTLTTHDLQGLTKKDFDLAKAINKIQI
tara:strand:+ start:3233 stop:3514 length:282 start_codon:yes stop_codon:yes gene_type:complete